MASNVCVVCQRDFGAKWALGAHTRSNHSIRTFDEVEQKYVYKWPCPSCTQVFTRYTNLKFHIECNHKHTQGRSYVCSICSRIFTSHEELTNHVETDHRIGRHSSSRRRIRDENGQIYPIFVQVQNALQNSVRTFRMSLTGRNILNFFQLRLERPLIRRIGHLIEEEVQSSTTIKLSIVVFVSYLKTHAETGEIFSREVFPLRTFQRIIHPDRLPHRFQMIASILNELEERSEMIETAGSGWTINGITAISVECTEMRSHGLI